MVMNRQPTHPGAILREACDLYKTEHEIADDLKEIQRHQYA
jgi:hypothetical protein